MSVYVASSWRNTRQPAVVKALRDAGLTVYDFRNPDESKGFSWHDVGLTGHAEPGSIVPAGYLDTARASDYLAAVQHPRAVEGYRSDFDAMTAADTFVLVLPCGRSAHLELGWAAGSGRRTAVLLDDPCTPELMYRMVDLMTVSLDTVVGWAGAR